MSNRNKESFQHRFNRVVRQSVRAHDTVTSVQAAIKKNKTRSPILNTTTNEKFAGCVDGMVESGRYMRSREFVFNNIEHLEPRTLKNILSKGRVSSSKIVVTRKRLTKHTRVDSYDEAVIVKMLIKGVSPERVLEVFPQYTRRQLLRIKRDFVQTRTESYASGVLGVLLRIQKNRNNWF